MNKIKDLLSDMRLVLCNSYNHFESDYHISESGVPYVHVIVNGKRYQFTYFGKGKFFRIFDDKQNKTDIVKRNDVLEYFRNLRFDNRLA
jgi:hypothetical protein